MLGLLQLVYRNVRHAE